MKEIQKRFPADVTLERMTFLNDREIDGLLYAYFQSISRPYCIDSYNDVYETRVDKAFVPTQQKICEIIRVKTTVTYRKYLNHLLTKGYLVDMGEYYVLPQIEDAFFGIPLDTLKFFIDTLQENVVKVYIYLGQRYKYAKSNNTLYSFTKKEILEHLGMKENKTSLEWINNVLDCLINNGLIRVAEYRDGKAPRYRLVEFNTTYKQNFLGS